VIPLWVRSSIGSARERVVSPHPDRSIRVATIVALAFATMLGTPCQAEKRPVCRGAAQLVGECFTVHGRLGLAMGTPSIRIWRIGTNRLLGIFDAAPQPRGQDIPWLPPSKLRNIDPEWMEVYGDYRVCPLTRERPGWMQFVCIESASKLRAHRRN
jgi:hypothetical protein